jgi:hypothetical protein
MMQASMQEAGPVPRCTRLDRAIALLNEALNLIDEIAERPDIGARLQHVLDELRDECFD